jgi:CarD family transcriptional regulator
MQILTKKIFKIGDNVVYPSHGVGIITAEEIEVVGGSEVALYVISFSQDKLIVRVPKARAAKTGLRHLSSDGEIDEALFTLKGKARTSRGMWSKRAQEYESKINSGSVSLIAEVLRDLHKNVDDPNRSYSEKVIYELALGRFISEYAVSINICKEEAYLKVTTILNYLKD